MEWLWGTLAGAGVALVISSAQALFTKSVKAEVNDRVATVDKRVEAVEKDLLANYVSKSSFDKKLEELQRDSKRTLRVLANIQLILARHFNEYNVKDADVD